ncbi:MAG: hypothetical protein IKO56_05115 [Alphaproteobacteria bacterium]|nr:hypothetical protein [Alphaproteobacteria bacterium]
MFEIQGTKTEQTELAFLVDSLQETKTGQQIVAQLEHLLTGSPCILKFNKTMSDKGLCEFKQVSLNPALLPTQNEQIATLGHELAHAIMWDITKAAQHNAATEDEYALVRLLMEAHGHMMGDLILQELNPCKLPQDKAVALPWWQAVDLTTKEGRTLYLKKALEVQTGWAEHELQQIPHPMKFAHDANAKSFSESCNTFLKAMDTDLTLNEVLQMKPYSQFHKNLSRHSAWFKLKHLFSR